jgi:hypothetical protein
MMVFNWTVSTPMHSLPKIKISFLSGNKKQSVTIAVPILLGRFMKPAELQAPQFVAAWQKYSNEYQKKYTFSHDAEEEERLEAINAGIAKGMHMGIIANVERVSTNFCAAGTLHLTDDEEITAVPCLLRLETITGQNIFRVTVRSGSAEASEALAESLVQVLRAK